MRFLHSVAEHKILGRRRNVHIRGKLSIFNLNEKATDFIDLNGK